MVVSGTRILVVGLGNLPFPFTRHSAGHLVIDSLATRLGVRMAVDRTMGGHYGQTTVLIGSTSVTLSLFKPKALMNICGHQVSSALRKSAGAPVNMIVLHDSLSHKPCTVSHKFGGSANGHNGVRSVISALGGEAGFHRLRLGIGQDAGADAAEYVLGKLSSQERSFWGAGGEGVERVWKEIEKILSRGVISG